MRDEVFGALLVHELELRRPRVELDADGAPGTPLFDTVASEVRCRLTPARAASEDGLLGRCGEATHVVYLEPMDLRVADRMVLRPVQTVLAGDAPAGAQELEVESGSGLVVGAAIEVGSGQGAEGNAIAAVTETTIGLKSALEGDHQAGEAVSLVRQYEVLAVADEAGMGHHLRAVVRELM